MIKAEVIADSISEENKRLLTFKLRYPWFIHGEIMTHRVLSRNASSNRAIPLKKMLEEVLSDELRAAPVYWGAEQKGMEPRGELDFRAKSYVQNDWKIAALCAANMAEKMGEHGAHKSLCNRLLMPFTHANVIISGTEWDNFFGLRLDKSTDPTMRALAVAMWEAQQASTPKLLQPGEWHLPFVDQTDFSFRVGSLHMEDWMRNRCIKISVARCARISYESFETNKRSTVEEDLKLYDRLVGAQPLHASPAEHQATPDHLYKGGELHSKWQRPDLHGNFKGFIQYRKMIPGEAIAPLPNEYLAF